MGDLPDISEESVYEAPHENDKEVNPSDDIRVTQLLEKIDMDNDGNTEAYYAHRHDEMYQMCLPRKEPTSEPIIRTQTADTASHLRRVRDIIDNYPEYLNRGSIKPTTSTTADKMMQITEDELADMLFTGKSDDPMDKQLLEKIETANRHCMELNYAQSDSARVAISHPELYNGDDLKDCNITKLADPENILHESLAAHSHHERMCRCWNPSVNMPHQSHQHAAPNQSHQHVAPNQQHTGICKCRKHVSVPQTLPSPPSFRLSPCDNAAAEKTREPTQQLDAVKKMHEVMKRALAVVVNCDLEVMKLALASKKVVDIPASHTLIHQALTALATFELASASFSTASDIYDESLNMCKL